MLTESISFTNSQVDCEKLIKLMERFSATTENTIIGMGATGHYWLSVYSFLLALGYSLKVINPIQSDAFRKMYIRQTKTDRIDSHVIAQVMRFGQFSESSFSDEKHMALRQLCRYRLYIMDECSDYKRKVIALLDQVFHEYSSLFSDTFGVSSKEVLQVCPTPKDMLYIDSGKLSELLQKASHGRFGLDKAKEFQETAKNPFGVKVSQSGEFIGTQNKPSKRGSPYLRRAIWTAAIVAAFSDPVLSEYYKPLKARGKHHGTDIGAVSRKLCNIIFAVLRDNKPYVPVTTTKSTNISI